VIKRKKKMSYHRITEEERKRIAAWRQEKKGIREIARLLGRDASTISRELVRNAGERGYRPKQAHEKAMERALRPGERRFTEAMREETREKLGRGWTPEAVSCRARMEGREFVCKETLYKWIYAMGRLGDDLWRLLPRGRRRRKRRCPRPDRRGRIVGQVMIDKRPASVEGRLEAGHWEGDLINGSPGGGHLVTQVERTTRFTLVGAVGSKEAREVCEEVCRLFLGVSGDLRRSLTLDNGKEFARHEEVASRCALDVYFAHPYHSWERGTNENTNGLIRRLHPKGSSFAGFGAGELLRIEKWLNDRPRKCLGWRTPREALTRLLC